MGLVFPPGALHWWKVRKGGVKFGIRLPPPSSPRQGDVYAAEAMLARGLIAGAFIRRVTPLDRALFPHHQDPAGVQICLRHLQPHHTHYTRKNSFDTEDTAQKM